MEQAAAAKREKLPTHVKIVFGLLIGVFAGLAANLIGSSLARRQSVERDLWFQRWSADADQSGVADGVEFIARDVAEPIGKVFLRLVLMVVIPLVVSALALGVYGIGDIRKLGRVGGYALLFTLLLSSAAVGLGMGVVNLVRPGDALTQPQRELLQQQYAQTSATAVENAKRAKPLSAVLLDLIPENPLQEMVGALDGSSKGNGMLAVMVFALAIGIALTSLPAEKSAPLVGVLDSLFTVSMAIIHFAMRLAPIAVGCLVFSITARIGLDVVKTLGWFVAAALLGMGVHQFVVYSLVVRAFGGMSPRRFFAGAREAMFTAFGTSSSNATLPTSMRVAEENLGVPRRIAHFVLTVGATGNQNGTALYEGVVVLFLAQVFGVELTVVQQLTVMLMAIFAGVGTAGVPGGSLPMIVVVLQSVGVPAEGIGIILGVDRLLDMCRTVLNVTGDLAIAVCVAQRERVGSPPPTNDGSAMQAD